jgi:hypothetical protein
MTRQLATSVVVLSLFAAPAFAASAVTLIDDDTIGRYVDLGTVLNGEDAFFVAPGGGDPTVVLGPTQQPDISAAATPLGDGLTDPANPMGAWSTGDVSIPRNWTVGSENAIIYTIDGGMTGFTDVTASFGVDNGILVWLNGTFIGGAQRPGGPSAGEHQFSLGTLGGGDNFLQVLREDHGGGTGYTVEVTGTPAPVPLPAAGWMLVAAVGGLTAMRRRKA